MKVERGIILLKVYEKDIEKGLKRSRFDQRLNVGSNENIFIQTTRVVG